MYLKVKLFSNLQHILENLNIFQSSRTCFETWTFFVLVSKIWKRGQRFRFRTDILNWEQLENPEQILEMQTFLLRWTKYWNKNIFLNIQTFLENANIFWICEPNLKTGTTFEIREQNLKNIFLILFNFLKHKHFLKCQTILKNGNISSNARISFWNCEHYLNFWTFFEK